MSYYTSTALTVETKKAEKAVAWIKEMSLSPDRAVRHEDGACTFIWMDRNHFDSEGVLRSFLENTIGYDNYGMTVVDEDLYVERSGGGDCLCDIRVTFDIWSHGDDITEEVE